MTQTFRHSDFARDAALVNTVDYCIDRVWKCLVLCLEQNCLTDNKSYESFWEPKITSIECEMQLYADYPDIALTTFVVSLDVHFNAK